MHRLILFLFFLSLTAHGQDAPKTGYTDTVFSITTNAKLVKTDNIGYLYVVNKDEIAKLSPKGDTMFVSSNKLFGDISDIDGSFALKPLLFHKEQNMVTLLDNTLSLQGEPIILDTYDIYQPQVVCNSYAGNIIWIYTMDNFELIKLDTQKGIQYRSGNLIQQTGIEIDPNDMVEFGNKLYVNSPESGILVFDIFGTYIKLIPIKKAEYIQVFENGIAYKSGDGFFIYNTKSLETERFQLLSERSWMEISGRYIFTRNGANLTVIGRN